jgi:hypothetical protein
MKIRLGDLCEIRRIKCREVPRRDFTKLAENIEIKEAYEAKVAEKIRAIGESNINIKTRYEALKKAIGEAVEEVLPAVHGDTGRSA